MHIQIVDPVEKLFIAPSQLLANKCLDMPLHFWHSVYLDKWSCTLYQLLKVILFFCVFRIFAVNESLFLEFEEHLLPESHQALLHKPRVPNVSQQFDNIKFSDQFLFAQVQLVLLLKRLVNRKCALPGATHTAQIRHKDILGLIPEQLTIQQRVYYFHGVFLLDLALLSNNLRDWVASHFFRKVIKTPRECLPFLGQFLMLSATRVEKTTEEPFTAHSKVLEFVLTCHLIQLRIDDIGICFKMVKSPDQLRKEVWFTYETDEGREHNINDLGKATQHSKSLQDIKCLTRDYLLLLVEL